MIYFVKRISGGNYFSLELTIELGHEVEVTKTQYNYLNSTFGTSGHFTFRTAKAKRNKKASKNKPVEPEVTTVELKEPEPEVLLNSE